MSPSVYYVVSHIADGIASVLYRTLFSGVWMNWDRPLTTPWIFFEEI